KRLQEDRARERCAARGVPLAVLRASAVWGPGRLEPAELGPAVAGRRLVIDPQRPLRLTHVENTADALVTLLDPRAAGSTFNLDDGFNLSAWQFAAAVGPLTEPPLRPLAVPRAWAEGVLAAGGAVLGA